MMGDVVALHEKVDSAHGVEDELAHDQSAGFVSVDIGEGMDFGNSGIGIGFKA
jgi:hypothetical protein